MVEGVLGSNQKGPEMKPLFQWEERCCRVSPPLDLTSHLVSRGADPGGRPPARLPWP